MWYVLSTSGWRHTALFWATNTSNIAHLEPQTDSACLLSLIERVNLQESMWQYI